MDEVFDTAMEVERNPYGAWQAIQAQADRIEALIAERDALKAGQIDAIRAALEAAAEEAETEGWSSPDALRIGFTEREEGSRDCAERIAQAIRALTPPADLAKRVKE